MINFHELLKGSTIWKELKIVDMAKKNNMIFLIKLLQNGHKKVAYIRWHYKLARAQASLLGEAITGKGILAQLNLETGIPIYEAEPLLLFFILFNLLGAIGALGDRGRFVDEATGLDKAVVPPGKDFRSALGLGKGGKLSNSWQKIQIKVYISFPLLMLILLWDMFTCDKS